MQTDQRVELVMRQEPIDVTREKVEARGWSYTCLNCETVISHYHPWRRKFTKAIIVDGERIPQFSAHCPKCWRRIPERFIQEAFVPNTAKEFISGPQSWKATVELGQEIPFTPGEIVDIGFFIGEQQFVGLATVKDHVIRVRRPWWAPWRKNVLTNVISFEGAGDLLRWDPDERQTVVCRVG